MKVLFDNGTPAGLREFIDAESVALAHEMGWADKENGDLLDLAEQGGYNVLVTTDKNIPYQQNLTKRNVGIVILPSTRWESIRALVREINEAIAIV